MPRQPRLVLSDVALHVIQRGNNRTACFRETSDYLVYLANLHELSLKLGCSVHAYCLMTNHVHLLLTPSSQSACTDLMRDLGQRYVQYFNRRHGRTGTLWEGRFRSCIAASSDYVLACYRYIELNPVRAGMVPRPEDFSWSSHRVNIGQRTDSMILPHSEYLALASDIAKRHAAYRRLFERDLEASELEMIRRATKGGYPLTSEAFKSGLASTGRRVERGRAGRPPKESGNQSELERKSGSDPDLLG